MILENIGDYIEIVLGIIVCAKIYCAMTDTPTIDECGTLYARLYKVIESTALIFGKMKK